MANLSNMKFTREQIQTLSLGSNYATEQESKQYINELTETENAIKKKVSHYVTHDAHHSQMHSQQRTLTQHNMQPQCPVNIMELLCECF